MYTYDIEFAISLFKLEFRHKNFFYAQELV